MSTSTTITDERIAALLGALRRLLTFNEQLCQDVGVSTHYPSADFARALIAQAEWWSRLSPPLERNAPAENCETVGIGDRMRFSTELLKQIDAMPDRASVVVMITAIEIEPDGCKCLHLMRAESDPPPRGDA